MNKNELESTKNIFIDEVAGANYNVDNLYEDNYFEQKIGNYIIESVKNNKRADCLDNIEKILSQKGFDENIISEVSLIAELQFSILEKYIKSII